MSVSQVAAGIRNVTWTAVSARNRCSVPVSIVSDTESANWEAVRLLASTIRNATTAFSAKKTGIVAGSDGVVMVMTVVPMNSA